MSDALEEFRHAEEELLADAFNTLRRELPAWRTSSKVPLTLFVGPGGKGPWASVRVAIERGAVAYVIATSLPSSQGGKIGTTAHTTKLSAALALAYQAEAKVTS